MSYMEFLAAAFDIEKLIQDETYMKKVYNMFDTDGDGTLTIEDYRISQDLIKENKNIVLRSSVILRDNEKKSETIKRFESDIIDSIDQSKLKQKPKHMFASILSIDENEMWATIIQSMF